MSFIHRPDDNLKEIKKGEAKKVQTPDGKWTCYYKVINEWPSNYETFYWAKTNIPTWEDSSGNIKHNTDGEIMLIQYTPKELAAIKKCADFKKKMEQSSIFNDYLLSMKLTEKELKLKKLCDLHIREHADDINRLNLNLDL